MSRYITERGAAWDQSIRLVQTFDTNFAGTFDPSKPQNGLDWQVYGLQVFDWLRVGAVTQTIDSPATQRLVQIPKDNGDEDLYRVAFSAPLRQVNVNEEISAILHRGYWDEFGVGDLATLTTDDTIDQPFLRLSSVKTPAAKINLATCAVVDPVVTAVDTEARTITVAGQPYYRKRATTTFGVDGKPVYDIGRHMGLHRYLRDELTSDAEGHLDDFKEQRYPFMLGKKDNDQLLIDRIVDIPEKDVRIGAYPSDTNEQQKYPVSDPETTTSEHVLYMRGEIPPSVVVGETISLERRLPWVSTMLSTDNAFSQRYGVWDFRLRFHWKKRQFSSLFLWPSHVQVGTLINWNEADKNMEIDVVENPGGTTSLFHNTHRPIGGMLDYADVNGLTPVMSHPEWTEEFKQQHQVSIPPGHPHRVNPYDWWDVRVAIPPPGSSLPEGSVLWYVRTNDGVYRFTGGCLLSPEASNGILESLQLFICNPVDGGFVADMEYFEKGQQSDDIEPPIHFDVAYVKCYQFPGEVAGGSGLPSLGGIFPNGYGPTPNDITGMSGTGVVTVADKPGDPGTPPTPTSGTVERVVANSADDAEQRPDTSVTRISNTLPMGTAAGTTIVGVRFADVRVPQGAIIDSAYVQFTAAEDGSDASSAPIFIEDAGNAAPFSATSAALGARAKVGAPVDWTPEAWINGNAGAAQRTPDLATLVKAVVDRNDWASGNALAFYISGTGDRVAYSVDASSTVAPVLHIAWRSESSGPGTGGGSVVTAVLVESWTEVGKRLDGSLLEKATQ